MTMGVIYYLTFLGLFIILLTLLIQWFVASKTKASQAGAISSGYLPSPVFFTWSFITRLPQNKTPVPEPGFS